MLGRSMGIIGLGSYLPEVIISSEELIEKFGPFESSGKFKTAEDIFQLTGIKYRRYAQDNQENSDLALLAVLEALTLNHTAIEEIDKLILASSIFEMFFPSTATILERKLGEHFGKELSFPCFDISAACARFIFGLKEAYQAILSSDIKKFLVVGSEIFSRLLSWQKDEIQTDWKISTLFGDGAGTAILGPVPEGYGILAIFTATFGKGSELTKSGGLGTRKEEIERKPRLLIKKDGHLMFRPAIEGMVRGVRQVLELAQVKIDEVERIFPHQANLRISEGIAQALRIPVEKIFSDINKYGNTGSASIPIALKEAQEKGKLRRDRLYLLTAAGAGITTGAALIKWW